MKRLFAIAGMTTALATVEILDYREFALAAIDHPSSNASRLSLEQQNSSQGRYLISQFPQPSGAQILEQGGAIVDKTAPFTQPFPNYLEADHILNAAAAVARQEAQNDIIRQGQDEDLVTDSYVGNPDYFMATDGQQFGADQFYNWPASPQPFPPGI